MSLKLLLILPIISSISAQLYYPDDNGEISFNHQEALFSRPSNTTPVRITYRTYEEYVDDIISNGILKLTLAINKAIIATSGHQDSNIVFAPVSISGALQLLLLGSNGKTFKEIVALMGLATGVADIEQKTQTVHEQFGRMLVRLEKSVGFDFRSGVYFATALFIQNNYPIRQLYKQTAETLYQSEVLNLDFQQNPTLAQKTINAWVFDRTKGKIKEILSDAPPTSTKVLLANALYFQAEWEYPFFDGTTKRRPFFTNGRDKPSTAQAEMMANGGYFPYYKDVFLDCEILGFPYKGNRSTMYVVKPNNSNMQKLKELETRITAADIDRFVDKVKYTSAVVLFPKMLIESTLDLRTTLQQLGLNSLFNPAEANLALLSPGLNVPSHGSNLPRIPDAARQTVSNPLSANDAFKNEDGDDVLIFNRFGEPLNCSEVFDPNSNVTQCQQVVDNSTQKVTYKRFGNKIGRRVARQASQSRYPETLDSLRQSINQHANPNSFENPGLYADQVIHKVYMHVTETGTEAAASTYVSLSRDGSRVTFRVDVPFLFFIRHDDTKVILFWGSVNTPTPSFK